MHHVVDSMSSVRAEQLLAPRFMGPLIAGILLALVCFSILVSITFQNNFVPAPLIVRGGNAYPMPLVSTAPPQWQLNSSGTRMQVIKHR